MTPREWILKCFAAGVKAAKAREARRAANVADSPNGRTVRNRKTGNYTTKPWPPPRPIGCSPKKIFGAAADRPRGMTIDRLEAELKALCADGTLGFTSGVWWRR